LNTFLGLFLNPDKTNDESKKRSSPPGTAVGHRAGYPFAKSL
jgi:hypothetical protein